MSTITVDNIKATGATTSFNLSAGVTKAALLYNQAGPSITGSHNISSVTDNSIGNFTINFTNSFADATYQKNAGPSSDIATAGSASNYSLFETTDSTRTTSAVQVLTRFANAGFAGLIDCAKNSVSILGDLA